MKDVDAKDVDMRGLIRKLKEGKIKFHQLDDEIGDVNLAAKVRRRYLEETRGVSLDTIGSYSIDGNLTKGRNIENMIGTTQIPVGVAGPLMINGQLARGEYYIPLATTEGALVASVNRGCKAITLAGGASALVVDDKMSRGPVFRARNAKTALAFVEWIRENEERIREKAQELSRHFSLKRIRPWIIGRNVFLRFEGTTGDAMGMNMVTIGVENACKWMEKEWNAECGNDAKCGKDMDVRLVAVSGNACIDKKPSSLNTILGRGKTVVADVVIPAEVVEKAFKASPRDMVEVAYRKNLVGSALAGSYGFNAHFANIIAAIYIATGQDAAHVVEGSHGFSLFELDENGDLYASVTLPAVQVGTVGGGTSLPTQREALALLGIAGGGDPPGSNAAKFAEIIGAAVLAGELSLVGALAAGHLGRAHQALGRKKR